jgi:large subunit ribosomal protein L25
MANHIQLQAEKRTILGKKVRRLRREGKTPATVYGYNTEPQTIQLDSHDVRKALREAGRTQVIDLDIDGTGVRSVLVRQTAVDAKRNQLLHVEFYQANMSQKLITHVPVHPAGESQAVKDGGILLMLIDHIDIESLPDAVPAGGIEVDLSSLVDYNSVIHAGELPLPSDVTLVTAADEIVVKINPPITEEEVEEVLAEAEPLPAELGGDETPPDAVPEAG